jgi:hypothetical protein
LIAVHHADRQARGFEHRTLLDMQFRIGQHLCRAVRCGRVLRRIELELRQCLAHRHAIRIGLGEQRGIERSRDGAAAEQRRSKAHALLIAKADYLDGERQSRAGRVERSDAFDRAQHAEHAVVLAGVAHGVEVRPQHEARQPRPRAFVAANAIAHGVDVRGHPGRRASMQAPVAFASRCCEERNTRVSPPSCSDRRPNASQ